MAQRHALNPTNDFDPEQGFARYVLAGTDPIDVQVWRGKHLMVAEVAFGPDDELIVHRGEVLDTMWDSVVAELDADPRLRRE